MKSQVTSRSMLVVLAATMIVIPLAAPSCNAVRSSRSAEREVGASEWGVSSDDASVRALAATHLDSWKALNQALASNGRFHIGDGPDGVVLSTTLGDRKVEDLMGELMGFPEGRRILAWSGVHLLGLAFISDPMWVQFQDWAEARGLPRPPDIEPSYDVQLESGQLVIMIREDWRDDVVTLAREAEYTTTIDRLYNTGELVSREVDTAFDHFLDQHHPGLSVTERNVKRDIFARLYGNLRSRRTVKLADQQRQQIDSYYRRYGILAGDTEFRSDLRESVAVLFRDKVRGAERGLGVAAADIFYYGTTLFHVDVPDGMRLGTDSARDLTLWIESNVDVEDLIADVALDVDQNLNHLMTVVLQPQHPDYYRHLPFHP